MAVPFPNLTFATPSNAQSSGALNPSFAVGRGASAGSVGGIPGYVWLAALVILAAKMLKDK